MTRTSGPRKTPVNKTFPRQPAKNRLLAEERQEASQTKREEDMKAKCKRYWYQQDIGRLVAHSCTIRYGHTGPHQCHCGDERSSQDINPHKPS